ncbi:PepSY domain-containing protein [Nonomuraea sp. NPDC059194]|uniref:PepSY domain-containing protein n=1 Tax=Nonomuraea sp. NPDC059194 TaxID=3346764 RepID=UPI0036BD4B4A
MTKQFFGTVVLGVAVLGAVPDGADLRRAGEAATAAVPGSTLITIETEEGGRLWEVQVVDANGTEHEMDVLTGTGRIASGPTAKTEDEADRAKHRERLQGAKLDYAQAAEKVESAVAGGRITELDLDTYRGATVWEADVVDSSGTKHELKVDADKGTIVSDSRKN